MIAKILAAPVGQAWVAASSGGSHRIAFDIGSAEVLSLLLTFLLFLVARLLDAAQSVADDAAQIV